MTINMKVYLAIYFPVAFVSFSTFSLKLELDRRARKWNCCTSILRMEIESETNVHIKLSFLKIR